MPKNPQSPKPFSIHRSGNRRVQREQHNLKAPQERAFRDEEIEDVPAESVRLERR